MLTRFHSKAPISFLPDLPTSFATSFREIFTQDDPFVGQSLGVYHNKSRAVLLCATAECAVGIFEEASNEKPGQEENQNEQREPETQIVNNQASFSSYMFIYTEKEGIRTAAKVDSEII